LSNAIGKKVQCDLTVFKKQTEVILADVRRISRDLRPALLDQLGLESALKRLISDLGELSGIKIDSLFLLPKDIAKDQQIVIYRVTQEALTNIARHAEAKHASVTLTTQKNYLQLLIEDDGKGFVIKDVNSSEHVGLAGMRERIELAGGTFVIESSLGKGTIVRVRLMQRT
jgi:signal transduction histidine kinase